MKEEKNGSKKKRYLIIGAVILFLALVGVILYLLFFNDKSIKITLDLGDGTKKVITLDDEEVLKLPDAVKKEGKVFSGWVNEKGEYVLKTSLITKDASLKPVYFDKSKKIYTLTFNDEDNVLGIIKLAEGETIVLPIKPQKDGYIFQGWLDEDGKLISEITYVSKDHTYVAYFVKETDKLVNVTVDLDDYTFVIRIVKGKIIILPVNPTKDGKVFGGWMDQDGNIITDETIVDDNIKLTPIWKEPFTCPDDCNPVGDGSTCEKKTETDLKEVKECPSSAISYNGSCLDWNQKESASLRQCDDFEPNSTEVYYKNYCVKKVSKVTVKKCSSGYEQVDNKCVKTETIKCQAN